MTKENVSVENVFLKTVFRPRNWETYLLRKDILSSPDCASLKSIDFPVEVSLELTNYCNLKCVMCPVPNLKRPRGFMDETVFKKVVADISGESGFLFLPQGFGESLLHRHWQHLIDHAHGIGIHPIVVLSNGMLLDGENIGPVMEMADVVVVTIDGCTKKTYESVRVNASFERVTKNIENFLKYREDAQSPHLVLRIIKMQDTENDIEGFSSFWSEKIGKGDIIQVSDCIDWAGSVTYRGINDNQMQKDRHPCRMLWKNLTVYHDGQVSPCCYDAEGELTVGSVLNQSLREIWNGSSLKHLRELHLLHQYEKIPICSRCRNWQ